MQPSDVRIARLTRNLNSLAEGASLYGENEVKRLRKAVADARSSAQAAATRTITPKKKGRAAVVSWDLGHNPAGRAYVLYRLLERDWNVDLVGPLWSRYGTQLWEPLLNCGLKTQSFHCSTFEDFIPKAEALAATERYDIVYVCKPRLPSLYLGALIKDASQCPLVLDVDDYELSFFKNEDLLSLDELRQNVDAALHEPFEEQGTRYAQTLIPSADAITVSNVALRQRFGGHMVRHARDESEFRNTPERRQEARTRLGIDKQDFALVFIGTPRPHKGVLQVAQAMQTLNDPQLVLHIVGKISDQQMVKALNSLDKARIVCHPNCAFDDLPNLLAGADLVPLIQDLSHPISQYQIPAKVSDALSLGIPVLATSTPPLKDLIAAGLIHEADAHALPQAIATLKRQIREQCIDGGKTGAGAERRNFVNELGLSVNRVRLELAIDEAREVSTATSVMQAQSVVSRVFENEAHDDGKAALPAPLHELVELFRTHYASLRRQRLNIARERRGEHALDQVKNQKSNLAERVIGRVPAILSGRSVSYDIAFFWKQNDSGLYGRRSDMIAKGLVESGRVRKMLHFDAPVSAFSLKEHFCQNEREINGQQELILQNLIDRQMGVFDTPVVRCRTHVFSQQPKPARLLSQPIHNKDTYARFVHQQLEDAGMSAGKTLAWFCPVIWNARELIDKVGFGGVVADLIDDQRAWQSDASYKRRLETSYRDTLGGADLVFSNCESLADAMSEFASPIHVVPNGAERFQDFPKQGIPEILTGLKGPIAGYVGNLRDRIDWTLLHEVVPALPHVNFVFFGPSSNNANMDSLARFPNVHVLGVLHYSELAFHLMAFDVALVPHLNNQLTERMNPLKVYNYFAAGLPIVSTEVSNLEDMGSSLTVARTSGEFIEAIESSLANGVDTQTAEWNRVMDDIAWDSRVNQILQIMDQSLHRSMRKSA